MARNKFKGTCYKCGLLVDVGTGHFERHNGTWRTQHALHPGYGRITCAMAEKRTLVAQDSQPRHAIRGGYQS